ncbi:hypothetical protein SASPL_123801 [Salvia splendens]|uniref:phosphoglycerate kinase n=1 Tax=Salvia splendens TaxID=180675 RepID=A0A8X8ZSD1_SALSN|nr:hypothetical protein SASPL_123801 [Salvia splendens]
MTALAKKLRSWWLNCQMVVFFSWRIAHASTEGVTKYLKPSVAGFLMQKVDVLILGGGMIFTFYKAQGLAVGSSLVEA